MNSNTISADKFYKCRDSCRVCGENTLEEIIRFPHIPIADSLLEKGQLDQPELKLPLTFVVCTGCFHAQVREDVLPEVQFNKDYPYYTGVSRALSDHFISSAHDLIGRFHLDRSKKVIEIASNDGTMLEVFNHNGCSTLGIDPASGPCRVAVSKGLRGMNTFFSLALSHEIESDFGKADLILGNNVLAHVPEPGDLVSGIANLLAPEGHVVIEVPHLLALINNMEFDTIFHQHYSYFSIHTAEALFRKYGLYLNDVEQIPIHGGSIRLFFSWRTDASENVTALKKRETEAGIKQIFVYRDFAQKVAQIIAHLKETLSLLKDAGKANTLINVSGIGTGELEYIADLSVYKQGMYFTGAHLLIAPPGKILEDMPDYVLVLAWNFKEEIIHQLSDYHKKGGRFIIPIPEVMILE